ncbi:MAG: 50S ribosomal protein L11 methyltransferase, partial [Candidatus Omnitrophica bacterium]|nr:50S ribosomal protein L11 methyltransferase [Candidatus Omnitrophota bacterium]
LPPVDVFIGGGYDVTDSERNRAVVSADVSWLQEHGYSVYDNEITLAGTGRTVALIATRQDGAMLGRLERLLQDALNLPADKLERSVLEINGRKVDVTQYRNAQFEEVPYFRVGDMLVVNQAMIDGLPLDQRALLEAYPGVIILDQREFTDAFAYERLEGYGGFTIGVIASMQAFREHITGQTFVDFGAGTGVLSIVASRLGAREVIVIEGREDVQDVLTANLSENGVLNFQRFEQVIESIAALSTTEDPVFALNLPYFGLLAGSGEPSNALRKAFDLVPDPAVAIVSGGSFGRGAIDDYVMKLLDERGASTVIESVVMKEKVSDMDLAVSNVFTAVYRADVLQATGGDQAILSHTSRQKYLQRFIGLVDRYIDRIPPQFPHPTGPVDSLTQNNPYFEDFLKALDIEVVISPQSQRQGFWKHALALDSGEQRRLMDLLASPERIPDGQMPEKWSVVFYKQEPLLLL